VKLRLFFSMIAIPLMTVAFAQGPRGPQEPGMGQGPVARQGAGLNMNLQTTVEGVISSVQIAYGAQYPSIVVDKTQIKVAPVWYLLDNGFELKAGDAVKVVAAPSLNAGDAYLYAVSITKTATGTSLVIRSEAGVPLWTGNGANQAAPRQSSLCIDPASIHTATGTIDRVNAGLGIQFPELVLKLQDGTLLTLKLGPERLLLAADFELNPGATLTVSYATATCDDELVALQLTDAQGNTLILRDPDGRPRHP